jgi:hypothetical protein
MINIKSFMYFHKLPSPSWELRFLFFHIFFNGFHELHGMTDRKLVTWLPYWQKDELIDDTVHTNQVHLTDTVTTGCCFVCVFVCLCVEHPVYQNYESICIHFCYLQISFGDRYKINFSDKMMQHSLSNVANSVISFFSMSLSAEYLNSGHTEYFVSGQ